MIYYTVNDLVIYITKGLFYVHNEKVVKLNPLPVNPDYILDGKTAMGVMDTSHTVREGLPSELIQTN